MSEPDEQSKHSSSAPATVDRLGMSRVIDAVGLFSRGVAMGAADIVPGISGGTIALISGVYERMIDALGTLSLAFAASLVRGRPRQAMSRFTAMQWGVMAPLFGGVLLSDVLMSQVIPPLMEDHPGPTYAFFFGLIAAAVWVPFARMRSRTAVHFVIVLIAAAAAWGFVGLQPDAVRLQVASSDPGATTVVYPNKLRRAADFTAVADMGAQAVQGPLQRVVVIDPNKLSDQPAQESKSFEIIALPDREALGDWLADAPPIIVVEEKRSSLPWIFVFGVIAISAMILPGLSGAFLMLFFGQYHALLSSIHGVAAPLVNLLTGHDAATTTLGARPWIDDAIFLVVFNIGVVIGVAAFSRVVRWLLHHAHDVTMAALTGLMIGALRQPAGVVWRAGPSHPENYWGLVIAWALAGAALVLSLNWLDSMMRSRRRAAN